MIVLALCWHPGRTNIRTAGGFKRFFEIVKRSPVPVIIIDKYPTVYSRLGNPNVTVVEYGQGWKFTWLTDRFISAYFLLINSLRLKSRPEIIYVPFSELPHLSFVAVVLKLIFHCRLVFCNLNTNKFFTDRLANAFFHRFADEIITLSGPLKTNLAKTGIFATHINGVGFSRSQFSVTPNKKLYDGIFIGRHTPEKGYPDLLDVWAILVNKYSLKLKLVSIGDLPVIYQKSIESKINEFGLTNLIKLMGNVSDAQKNLLISQSKICVFPSYSEGWGIVPMECLSRGLPVVAYDLPVYAESISATDAFKTAAIGSKELFASRVVSVLKQYPRLAKKALEWKPKFTWDTISRREWKLICPA